MAKNVAYFAMGEEATRNTGEVSTVGFLPAMDVKFPVPEYGDEQIQEVRGEDVSLGATSQKRWSQKHASTLDMPFYTEAGVTAGMVGTLLKHFFGKATSAQNAATGQYYHMLYPIVNAFAAANLGTKALTYSTNLNLGATMKNWPWLGNRIKSITFKQTTEKALIVTIEKFGQTRGAVTAELGSATFPAENLRCDYTHLTLYTGTITRVGSAPNFTDFTFGSATAITPYEVTLKLTNPFVDRIILAGVDYPSQTNYEGEWTAELDIVLDWEDPAAGFSSVDDHELWIAGASTQNFFLYWDTGTQAGTGDNHSLYIDLPSLDRKGGQPEYSRDDPKITLSYGTGLLNATTAYKIGMMLKNTAAAI